MDTRLFFPEPKSLGLAPVYDPIVRTTCAACPVKNDCFTNAKMTKSDGFWGGSTPTQRGYRINDRSKAAKTAKQLGR